jgi:hypothetical protein
MRAVASLSTGLLLLICAGAAHAQAAKTLTERNAPLVRALEALYNQSMQAAQRGDLEGYWHLRTAASRTRPPALDSARLQLLAGMLPPLEGLDFVRLDSSDKAARAMYRWRKQDVAQYSVIVYRREQGEWRIDDVSVRRNGGGASAAAPAPAATARPVIPPVAAPAAGLDRRAQELLKAWESGGADASRSLSAPRL